MTIDTSATWIYPVIMDGKYCLHVGGTSYLVDTVALAAIIFAEWRN